MIRAWGDFLQGFINKKSLFSIFWSTNPFSYNLTTINLKNFPNYGVIYSFAKIFSKVSEEGNCPEEAIEIWGDASSGKTWRTRVEIDTMFAIYLILTGGWDIILKREGNRRKGWLFWNKEFSHMLLTSIAELRKFCGEVVYFFNVFFDEKRIGLKKSLDPYCYAFIIGF